MSRVCLLSLAALLVSSRAFAVAESLLADSEGTPAGIVNEKNATTEWLGELGKPFKVSCLASEPKDPTLFVAWYQGPGKRQLLFRNPKFEQRTNVLYIKSLSIKTLGQFVCQVFNASTVQAPRMHIVRAYMPEGLIIENPWLVPRGAEQLSTPMVTTTTSITKKTTLFTGRVVPRVTVSPKVRVPVVDVVVGTIAADKTNTTEVTEQFTEREFIGRVVPHVAVAPKTLLPVTLGPKTQLPATLGQITEQFTETSTSSTETNLTTKETIASLETSERSTTYDDAADVTFPTTLDPCAGFQFGCCADNKTEATGPDQHGCLCNTTELGCRLGSVSSETSTSSAESTATTTKVIESFRTSERGTTYEDTTDVAGPPTLDPCAGFQFGCCADNETEATGPDQHGCPCNATALGCSPDGVSSGTLTSPAKMITTTNKMIVSIESSERSTTYDDATDVTDPDSLDPCCADNEIKTTKSDEHGGPSNATEFGCYSNGVSPDPDAVPAGIAGDENAVAIGELGRPLHVTCPAFGYPTPSVFWFHGTEGPMVHINDADYETRENILLIRNLTIETLGEYTCQAYNGVGKAASWVVLVQAYKMPDLLVPQVPVVHRPGPQAPVTTDPTATTTPSTTEALRLIFTVPVSVHLTTKFSTLNIGTDLYLTCDLDGYPEPEVHWTKDGANIQTDRRITITGSVIKSLLTVKQTSVADSGLYACHASNRYSSQSDTAQINVKSVVVPAKCEDNPFFANCNLIVRSKFCKHKYYSKFCCMSCVNAGQLDIKEAELQADQPLRKK